MKKALSIIFFLCFVTQVFAQVNIRELKRVENKFFNKDGTPFTGDFVAYHKNGKLQAKGAFKNGLPDGIETIYDGDGNKSSEITYKNGLRNGPFKEYFENGSLKQEVNSLDDKDDGKAIVYYETGEKHIELNFDKGVQVGDYTEYDKQGKVTRKLEFVDGKASYGKQINELVTAANEKAHQYKSAEAIALYTKAIDINPSIAELYFDRGAAKGISFDFDGAIADYDKAIELNPDYKEAYANRGSAKINKYTSRGIIEPTAEQSQSACEDFYKAKDLGDSEAVEDMIYVYCERNHIKPKPKKTDTTRTDNQPLMFLDGKVVKKTDLEGINPNDILELEVLKEKSATAKYGADGINGVIIMTSINFGVQSYQKMLGAFSKDYLKDASIPDTFLYQINHKPLTGKHSDIVGKLYHLEAGDIKEVSVIKNGSATTVNIITK